MTLSEPVVQAEVRFRLLERYRRLDGLLLRLLTEAGAELAAHQRSRSSTR